MKLLENLPVDRRSMRFLLFGIFSAMITISAQGQTNSVFNRSSLWIKSEIASPWVDSSFISEVGQYLPLNIDSVERNIADSYQKGSGFTGVVVITPKFDSVYGETFLKIGSTSLLDNGVQYKKSRIPLKFEKGTPVIIAMRPQGKSFGNERIQKNFFVNDSLFEITELIFYNEVLSSDEVRKVETYLALKYSINITDNSIPVYRNYFSLNNGYYWEYKKDGLFYQYVIGLGKNSQTGFDQTQTFTNEVGRFSLGLDSIYPIGTLNPGVIQDSSLVIFSKNPRKNNGKKCRVIKTPSLLTNWKIRLTDWSSSALNFVFSVKVDNYSQIDSLEITDGTNSLFLAIAKADSTETIAIPIDFFQNGVDYFIKALDQDVECEDDITIDMDSTGIQVIADPDQLPINGSLLYLNSGDSWEFTMNDPVLDFSSLPDGQYQVTLGDDPSNPDYHKVLAVEDGGNSSPVISSYSLKDLNNLPSTSKYDHWRSLLKTASLHVYPNPSPRNQAVSFELFDFVEGEYAVKIVNSKGQVLFSEDVVFFKEQNLWTYQFSVPGTYTVLFVKDGVELAQTVIIK